ncbi:MAG: hypothetical protein OK452_07790 [Thaumarchaeota archaeon]|nr:hypothetical protein [Nitrososphaerota archaeon]
MLTGDTRRGELSAVGGFGGYLGHSGALLDFFSGNQILSESAVTTGSIGMGENGYTPSGLAWGVGIEGLGVLLLITAVASVTQFGMRRMKIFGAMMAVFGIVMLFIGVSMYSGVTPMMAGTAPSGPGMLAVGALMVLNGAAMGRPRTIMAPLPATGHVMRNALAIAGIAIVLTAIVFGFSSSHGPSFGGMGTTSGTTSTIISANGLARVTASAVSCSGSGTTEQCRMTLTNAGNVGTATTGAASLYYSGAEVMGTTYNTSNGCTVLSGSLDPRNSENVSCTFTVSAPASSGTQLSGTVALGDGTSVSFSATAS